MKTARMLVILVLALGLASVSLGAAGTWTKKANMPTARHVLSSSVVDGKVYAIGGSPGNCISTVEAYDPVTDTWTRKASMPMSRGGGASSVVNGRIYVIGGRPRLNGANISSVQEYDATTDTWTAKANMLTARTWLSSSVVNGNIYAIGGALTYQGTPLSTVEEYDPATDTWTRKADMPTARACVSTSAVNGKIYAIGGASYQWYQGISTVEEYNPATDTWTKKADMPTGRTYLSTSVVNGKIYAIGGLTTSGNHVSPVEEYDPATDTWTRKADMPTARSGLSTSAVNGKIYAIGGWVGSGGDVSTVEEYDPNPLYGDGIVAYWKLDETEGIIAHDSAAANDAVVFGDAVWQPDGGQVAGALAFDGIDDYVSTPLMLDPKDAVFSVFAWVKGGMPGQVVFSQAGLSDWLGADTTNGSLMTELRFPFKPSLPLQSQTVITDGNWHRIGLTWDGSNRVLYVDDVQVASDTYDKGWLFGGLQIGAGKNLDPGTFWSGLIDDVRIYNRAITKVATEPNPADGAEHVPIDTTLSWRPGLGAATHDVYFGTSSPPAFIGNQAANSFDPGPLELNTIYYWQVDEFDGTATYKGDVWSFNVAEPGLVGLWKLDETEGDIAYDSAGFNYGILNGGPLWQPSGGKIDGALAFDGIDDYVSTDFVLNPAAWAFSVFAWIKGGAAGQVIISQVDDSTFPGATWLGADPSDGKLITRLMGPLFAPLESESVITDGQWHHICLVYDRAGLHRYLYVDGTEVAKDIDGVAGMHSVGGLYFGAGKALDTGSFWSGLIDDVRIYNRAVTP